MALHDTTAKDEVAGHLKKAREKVSDLRGWLERIDEQLAEAIEKHDGGAFSGLAATTVMEEAFAICYQIAMANGACLVRSTR